MRSFSRGTGDSIPEIVKEICKETGVSEMDVRDVIGAYADRVQRRLGEGKPSNVLGVLTLYFAQKTDYISKRKYPDIDKISRWTWFPSSNYIRVKLLGTETKRMVALAKKAWKGGAVSVRLPVDPEDSAAQAKQAWLEIAQQTGQQTTVVLTPEEQEELTAQGTPQQDNWF